MSSSTTMDDIKSMFDDMLSKFADVNKRMTSFEETLASISEKQVALSTEVSSVKADQGRLHVAVNNVQSQIVPDVGAKAKASLNILGAGTQDNTDTLTSTTAPPPPPSMGTVLLNTASHKLRFPKYDGVDDPLPWLHKCE